MTTTLLALTLLVQAEKKSAAELMPATAVVYAEIADPKQALAALMDHPARKRLEAIDAVKAALKTAEYRQFLDGVALIEDRLGMTWREAIESLAEGGLFLCIDVRTQGVAVLARARDAESLEKARDALIQFARDADPESVTETEYRGVTAYKTEGGGFTTLGPWFVMTNNGPLGKKIIDAMLDGGETLAAHPRFKRSSGAAWAWVDVETLRAFVPVKLDNMLVELVAGVLVNHIRHAPYATASLSIEATRIALKVEAPHDDAWIAGPRQYAFGAAPSQIVVKETLMAMSFYRDAGTMWSNADELFTQEVLDGMAEADNNLTTLFSGKDFGEDILGAVTPHLQIVAARQSFEEGAPHPAIRLPAFAFVFRLKEPEKMRGDMRRTFQSLIGFVNIQSAQSGQPQLDLDMEKIGDHQIVTATYVPEPKDRESQEAGLHFNFSPSLAFAGDRMILASTKALARELVAQDTVAVTEVPANSRATLDAAVLGKIFDENRKHLEAQNMLEEGHSAEEARAQIDALLAVVGVFRGAGLKLATRDKTLELELEVDIAGD